MNKIFSAVNCLYSKILRLIESISFLPSLLLRLYLASLFWTTGWNKANSFSDTVAWFGNPNWGLGLPFPEINAALAVSAEIGGAALLALGLATRLACIPLIVTMIVAAATVHLKNGWQFIYDRMSVFPPDDISEAMERLNRAKEILRQHGDYSWLTEHGNIVMSNNGIELVAAYTIMLLALMVLGGGKYISLDYWIALKRSCRACCSSTE